MTSVMGDLAVRTLLAGRRPCGTCNGYFTVEPKDLLTLRPELLKPASFDRWLRSCNSAGILGPEMHGKGASVRHTLVVLISASILAMVGTPVARAGVTCQVIPQMCPPPPGGSGPSPVPEPGTLALLAAGAGAVTVALRRRGNKP